ncbi:MAG TPA: hypothetical protein VN176_16005 [Verrucomicrobiae bacterium]|nr:hypothetical protein [Verrucomicrobiae bacterium]
MKKLLTFVFAMLVGASLSFAQAGGGTTDTTKSPSTTKSKKHHKGGHHKKNKKTDGSANTGNTNPK